MQVNWLIDTYMLDRGGPTGFPTLAEAVREAGHRVHLTTYDPKLGTLPDGIPFGEGECVIAYGSHQFIKRVEKHFGSWWVPCAYHRVSTLSYGAYAPYLGDLLLNDDFVILPFAEMVRRRTAGWNGNVFIRPNAVTKDFTGFSIPEERFDQEINALQQLARPDPDLLVVVASAKPIDAEFRFVIADRQVVTGSEYRWDGRLDIRRDVHPVCEALAWEVARRDWQADTVYVCDVALVEGRGRVLELNTFSAAGLYACDTREVARQVSAAAWREFCGDQ